MLSDVSQSSSSEDETNDHKFRNRNEDGDTPMPVSRLREVPGLHVLDRVISRTEFEGGTSSDDDVSFHKGSMPPPSSMVSSDEVKEDDSDDASSVEENVSTSMDVQAELASLEAAERTLAKDLVRDPNIDALKGRRILAQLKIWDSLIELRIRLQQVVLLVNRLPQPEVFTHFAKRAATPLATSASVCAQTGAQLLALQIRLISQTSGLTLDKANRKRPRDSTASGLWDCVVARDPQLKSYVEGTLEKWHSKTSVAGPRVSTKRFKALNQSIIEQVNQMLADEARLIRRTQLKRTPVSVIGTLTETPSGDVLARDAHLATYDEEIFDDTDHYQNVLRELIERKSSSTKSDAVDSGMMGQQWAELSKLRAKVKRKVDTRASKGRKIRYEVFDKLRNFMAPNPTVHPSTEQAKDDLFSSLFRN